MFSLEETFEKCKKEELLSGRIIYDDNIPYSSAEITDNDEKSCLIKLLEGLALREENRNNNTDTSELLMKYVFDDIDAEKLQIDDGDVDNLIELRLIVDAESSYLERLDKLMFRIYFESGRCELEGLIYKIYDKYDWTKSLIEKYKDKERVIIFQEKTQGYNKKFGIDQNNENDGKMQYNIISQEKIEENWILRRFGG